MIHDVGPTPESGPTDLDRATRALLRRGGTVGCFHLESPAMRNLLRRMRCDTEHDVITASAVVRPGVASSGMLRIFLDRRARRGGRAAHPALAEWLPQTHGVLVFQEDVMRVAHHVCGFSLADADALRRALVHSDQRQELGGFRVRLVSGARAHGLSGDEARQLWDQVESFAGYAFCKAHAASFSRIGIRAAHLKAHRPAEFMAAVLSNGGGFYHPSVYVSECRRMGLRLESVCVQRSQIRYTGDGDRVRVGLMQVRTLRAEAARSLVQQRVARGPFRSLDDLVDRVDLHRRELDVLERCGALAGVPGEPPVEGPGLLVAELEDLGVGVAGHPMELIAPFLPPGRVFARSLDRVRDRSVLVAGWPVAARTLHTSGGRPMELVTLEDETGLMDIAVFPDAYDRVAPLLTRRLPCCARGRVTADDGVVSLVVRDLQPVALPSQNAVA